MTTFPFRTVHVDTQYVYAYAIHDGNENEVFLKDQLQEALSNRNSQQKLIISFVAMGEVINTIHRKSKLRRGFA